MHDLRVGTLRVLFCCTLGGWLLAAPAAAAGFWWQKVAVEVLEQAAAGPVDVIVILDEQAGAAGATTHPSKAQQGRELIGVLQSVAQRTQAPILDLARAAGAESRAFWIVNMVRVTGDLELIEALARRDDVARVITDARLGRLEPIAGLPDGGPLQSSAVEWHVSIVSAPAVWAQGVRGAGAVVGSMDTGFEWTHPALMRQYRGWGRGVTVHDYNWHDAIHRGSGPCGTDAAEPCDEDGHGTMTMGIAIGDDGIGNQIGIAPEARWIGCRCWEPIRRTHLSYVSECFQWFVAPTDQNGNNADPSRAPHVIFNSWICEPDEGCSDPQVLLQVVRNVRAAGIVVVGSAGNSGPECATVTSPPAIYAETFTVGATTAADAMANFSSRGPVESDASGRVKPDIVAPGQQLRTSTVGGGYTAMFSGTSFSGPVVAGVIALLVSAVPALAGDVDLLERIVRDTADPVVLAQACGGVPVSTIPNNVAGYGRVNAFAAYQRALGQTSIEPRPVPEATTARPLQFGFGQARPNPFNPQVRVEFDLPHAERVDLRVHDVSGRVVRDLAHGATLAAGRWAASWDGRDAAGREVPSGVYFLRLQAGPRQIDTQRITLVR